MVEKVIEEAPAAPASVPAPAPAPAPETAPAAPKEAPVQEEAPVAEAEDIVEAEDEIDVIEPIDRPEPEEIPDVPQEAEEGEKGRQDSTGDNPPAEDEAGTAAPEEAPESGSEEDAGDDSDVDPAETADAPEEATISTKVTLPELAKSKSGIDRFNRAYSLDASRSPLMSYPSPLRTAVGTLRNEQEWAALGLPYEIDKTRATHLADTLAVEGTHIVKSLNKALQEPAANVESGKRPLIEILRSGADVTSWRARPGC